MILLEVLELSNHKKFRLEVIFNHQIPWTISDSEASSIPAEFLAWHVNLSVISKEADGMRRLPVLILNWNS